MTKDNLPAVDPVRLAEEWEADRQVLANLAQNGDRAELIRPVDVSFRGSQEALEALEDVAEEWGFDVLETEENEEGELSLFLGCEQTTEEAAIKALTEKCLRIETMFGLEYEGWGCVIQTGTVN